MDIRPLDPELQKLAEDYLKENANKINHGLQHIREWLEKQPHIKARTDSQWLISFIRGCKFSLERAKLKFDTFYTMRSVLKQFFTNRDPLLPELQKILRSGMLLAMTIPNKPTVLYGRIGLFNPAEIDYNDVIKLAFMCMDVLMLEDDSTVINGVRLVGDMKGFSLSHLPMLTPTMIRNLITCAQDGYPVRPKKFMILNPSHFEILFNMYKHFLIEKYKKRICVYSTVDDFFKDVPKSVIPNELGGTSGPVQDLIDYWRLKVESYRDWFMEDSQFGCDESKRQGKSKYVDECGTGGSFRKLELD